MSKSGKTVYAPDETRRKKRFAFESPLPATFSSLPVELIDISVAGAQIRHNDAFPLGKEAPLTVVVPATNATLSIRARVRWSRLTGRGTNGLSVYRSGLALTEERADVAADLVDQLVQTKRAAFDGESLEKKREALERKAETRQKLKKDGAHAAATAAEQLDAVRKARVYLQHNPVEMNKWLNRARYAANRQKEGHYSMEVLAVWEFLGRKVELTVVDLGFKIS